MSNKNDMRKGLFTRLLRRDSRDLQAAIKLAKGEEIPSSQLDTLRKAGIVRTRKKRPLPPALVAALLSLDETMERGRGVLRSLKDHLLKAKTPPEREVVISSMKEEMVALKKEMEETPDPELLPLVKEVKAILDEVKPDEADPGEVMTTAALAAEIIELIARSITPKKREKKKDLPAFSLESLAEAVDLIPALSKVVLVPDTEELTAALIADVPPHQTEPRIAPAPLIDRQTETQMALFDGPDPISTLFEGVNETLAMERHAALACLGRKQLKESGRYPSLRFRIFDSFAVGELVPEGQA